MKQMLKIRNERTGNINKRLTKTKTFVYKRKQAVGKPSHTPRLPLAYERGQCPTSKKVWTATMVVFGHDKERRGEATHSSS